MDGTLASLGLGELRSQSFEWEHWAINVRCRGIRIRNGGRKGQIEGRDLEQVVRLLWTDSGTGLIAKS